MVWGWIWRCTVRCRKRASLAFEDRALGGVASCLVFCIRYPSLDDQAHEAYDSFIRKIHSVAYTYNGPSIFRIHTFIRKSRRIMCTTSTPQPKQPPYPSPSPHTYS